MLRHFHSHLFQRAALALGLALACTQGYGQQLVDDFDRANNDVVGAPWIEAETATGSVAVKGNTLRMSSPSITGMDWAHRSLTGYTNMPLNTNTCEVTWMFNMRQSRTDPGGFVGTSYGVGVVLAGSTNDPRTTGQGYAVLLGQSGASDYLRLVTYSAGIGVNTPAPVTILTGSADLSTEFISVRVSYLPSSNLWTMYFDTSTVAFEHPALANILVGSTTNSTYVGNNLPNFICLWNHANASGPESAQFDNILLPTTCLTLPRVSRLYPTMALPESAGTVNIPFLVLPPPSTARTLTLNVTPSVATYGADFTTTPDGSGGSIAVNVPAWASVVQVPMTIIDDAIPEVPVETVLFQATALTGGTGGTIAPANATVVTIGDNDQVPTVLAPGDIAVVGVNSDNVAGNTGCAYTAEDLISFFCFKDITAGTTIDLTDNGYANTGCAGAGPWSDTEGIVRMTRTGPTIPAGTVITWRAVNTSGAGNVSGVGPDALWTCASLGGSFPNNPIVLPTVGTGDQLFFLQGGNWVDPNPASISYNCSYTGTVIAGFTTSGVWDNTTCTALNSSAHPDLACVPVLTSRSGNYLKYNGDITTPRTKGEWLTMIANPANWPTTWSHCSDYDALGHRWQDAPVFPVLPGEGTPGLWTGIQSTDWFDCRNWEDRTVPTASTPVTIDHRGVRDCIITNPSTTGATFAYCASLDVRSIDPAIARTLTVNTARRLVVSGPTTVERTTPGTACSITLLGNSWFTTAGLRLTGPTLGAAQATFSNALSGNVVSILGSLRVEQGGRLVMTNGWTNVTGDYVNLNGEAFFEETGSTMAFNGTTDQHVSTSGFEERFHTVRINKLVGDLYLDAGVRVDNNLQLTFGRVFENSSLLTLGPTAVASGASDNSFVHGPVLKLGSADFIFPVGKGNTLRPARLSDNTASTTQGFMVEYQASSPITAFPPSTLGTGVHHVSDCEYWNISRSGGTPSARVWLSWQDPYSCGVDTPADLVVVRWNGSAWEDRGNGGIVTNTVPTAAVQTAFSPWTLGSATDNNALPVELLHFDARPQGSVVDLTWDTASEQNNAYFTVERSADATIFSPILVQEGAGNSQSIRQYGRTDDRPLRGMGYYRLRQTDYDGTNTLSHVVPVFMSGADEQPLAVYASEGRLTVWHAQTAGTPFTVFDANGRRVLEGQFGSEGTLEIPFPLAAHGLYTLRSATGEAVRFVH